jgi:hypothetical protein
VCDITFAMTLYHVLLSAVMMIGTFYEKEGNWIKSDISMYSIIVKVLLGYFSDSLKV